MLFALTHSNLLGQLPDLNEIIRRLTANPYRKRFNRNIFMGIAIILGILTFPCFHIFSLPWENRFPSVYAR